MRAEKEREKVRLRKRKWRWKCFAWLQVERVDYDREGNLLQYAVKTDQKEYLEILLDYGWAVFSRGLIPNFAQPWSNGPSPPASPLAPWCEPVTARRSHCQGSLGNLEHLERPHRDDRGAEARAAVQHDCASKELRTRGSSQRVQGASVISSCWVDNPDIKGWSPNDQHFTPGKKYLFGQFLSGQNLTSQQFSSHSDCSPAWWQGGRSPLAWTWVCDSFFLEYTATPRLHNDY